MPFARSLSRLEPLAYPALRIVAGFMMTWHGIGKLFGFLGPQQAFGSQLWIGGLIELTCGVLIAFGLFTRIAAFVLSGLMAVAYLQFHWKLDLGGYRFLPVVNKGELAVLYCFVFLFIAAHGPGRVALDRESR